MKHILVPTDFSQEASQAFKIAKRQAELIGKEDAVVTILSVIEDLAPISVQFEFGLSYIDTKGLHEEAVGQAKKSIKDIAKEYFEGFKVHGQVVAATRPVYTEILEYAQENGVDLIVMATHGRTGFRHLMLGSVSERVVREAVCPVLVVPAEGK